MDDIDGLNNKNLIDESNTVVQINNNIDNQINNNLNDTNKTHNKKKRYMCAYCGKYYSGKHYVENIHKYKCDGYLY